MLYSFKYREDLEKLEELVLLYNHLEELRLQDKLEKPNFHVDTKKKEMTHLLIRLKVPLEI